MRNSKKFVGLFFYFIKLKIFKKNHSGILQKIFSNFNVFLLLKARVSCFRLCLRITLSNRASPVFIEERLDLFGEKPIGKKKNKKMKCWIAELNAVDESD